MCRTTKLLRGLGCLSEAEGAGTVQPREEKARGGSYQCIYIPDKQK